MSGTSIDGVDAVLAEFSSDGRPVLHALASLSMPEELRQEFLALNIPGHDELRRAALAGNALAQLYADATAKVLTQTRIAPERITAIGAHGQTVRHDPGNGYTIQINAPALLAERTGIPVIADFRTRDVAAGGQGAPLVPAFHHAVFANGQARAVLNLGGIANLTLLDPNGEIRGFDTGPANVLLDLWIHARRGLPYDAGGQWASTGKVNEGLLSFLLDSEPWLAVPPPKSTGRDLFNLDWLQGRLHAFHNHDAAHSETKAISAADIQATLQRLTARSVATALVAHAPETQDVLVCGGGAFNDGLMADLRDEIACPVRPTSDVNVPVQSVEALAFAWLAWAHVVGHKAGLPAVTGARHPNILGCRYPA
jgi:anhydro-N-acetylmuramic acid kinase